MKFIYILLGIIPVVFVLLCLWNGRLQKNRLLKGKRETDDLDFSEVLLKNVKAYLLLISPDFYVQKTNYYKQEVALTNTVPKRVGELLKCTNALHSAGCGTHEYCALCPIRQAITEAFRTRTDFSDVESSMQIDASQGESPVSCEVTVSGSFLIIGNEDRLLLTVHDITKLKNIQKELILAREQAESSDKLKTAFLANMSHEIRTPLNAIVGFSELLDTENEEEKRLYLDIIKKNNDLLLRLINDILDLAKIEAGTLDFSYADTDLNALVLNLIEVFQTRTKAGNPVEIRCQIPERGFTLFTDERRMTQVLSNFMSNALKFTEKGFVCIGYKQTNESEFRFFVSDTGPGIAEEQQKSIFDRFVKLDANKSGTGLGLSICRMIVKKLGGSIGVESKPGGGAVFWFTHPCETIAKSGRTEKQKA